MSRQVHRIEHQTIRELVSDATEYKRLLKVYRAFRAKKPEMLETWPALVDSVAMTVQSEKLTTEAVEKYIHHLWQGGRAPILPHLAKVYGLKRGQATRLDSLRFHVDLMKLEKWTVDYEKLLEYDRALEYVLPEYE
ncbi:hypothetical protein [Thiorhodococcus fuscus]|uniref:Transposase n=1 Tax=Thiorhodococcus fuscus TaxID=527200 RepID=A0ABW4Y641_9GAMM